MRSPATASPRATRVTTTDRRTAGLAALAALAALVLYSATLAPGVVSIEDDTLEFQLVALWGAIPHPSGYPLYAILLWLAARLVPFGGVAARANLLSALAAAAAVGMTVAVGRRLGLSRPAALLAALLLAIAPTLWAQATVAEVYALHLLISAGVVWALLDWGRRGEGLPVGAALLFGLGLAHHGTILLWIPAVAVYVALVLRERARPPAREWLRAGAALLAPLLLYLWLPLRAHVGSVDGTFGEVGVGCWVTACQYQESFFLRDNALARRVPPTYFARLSWRELGGALVLVLGAPAAWRRVPRGWLLVGLGGLANALFALGYVVPDREVFWIPVLWVLALLAGAGFDLLLRRASRAAPLLVALALLGIGLTGFSRLNGADRSGIASPPGFNGRDVLGQPLPDHSVVVGLLGEISYLRYLQGAEGLAPEVESVALPTDPPSLRVAAVERALDAGQRPFLTTGVEGLGARFPLAALGPLIEVRESPLEEAPSGLWPLGLEVASGIELIGWSRSPIEGSDRERITLAWHAPEIAAPPLHVSMRLVAEDGTVEDAVDRAPVRGYYPTPEWRPGEVVLDTYELPPPGRTATYLVILYDPADGTEIGRAGWLP